ncbi:TetR/AcrR family transcriptional regulator, partial [Streptomyces griseorubiginosus]|uniref:TetR/AcrR family transcriptional regulator n=1 Tax=Streptomyces griseorubiginosus TaxID=67304 RepID=UPI001AD75F7D
MNDEGRSPGSSARSNRKDARRNQQALLDAAAAVFVASGVDAPVRDIAAKAGVGVATIYRHFPTRADLVVAVYRHQIDACSTLTVGETKIQSMRSPFGCGGRYLGWNVPY